AGAGAAGVGGRGRGGGRAAGRGVRGGRVPPRAAPAVGGGLALASGPPGAEPAGAGGGGRGHPPPGPRGPWGEASLSPLGRRELNRRVREGLAGPTDRRVDLARLVHHAREAGDTE